MRTSRIALALIASPFILAACGDGGTSEEVPQGPPVVTEEVAELSTGELLGLDRANMTSQTPWRAGAVTRTASDVAPTSVQTGVEALTADGFDRLLLTFRSGAPAPGYRIRAAGTEPQMLCGEETTLESSGVLLQLTPARIRTDDGTLTVDAAEVDLGLPVIEGARLVCDGNREVVWFVETTSDAVEVRVLNLVTPERIAVDIRPGDTGPE
ncbi:MAG TPA: hypothetical protein VJ925_11325 [Longimicrobiales bacterium]|nr:hypothetical protein [Longimicrobiales bacterium]